MVQYIHILQNLGKLYIPFWSYSNQFKAEKIAMSNGDFTFHFGHILMQETAIHVLDSHLYIPFWSYSNPFSIIPPIYAI